METVLMVLHLLNGQLAYDYQPRDVCLFIQHMTVRNGNLVEFELENGLKLRATRIDCRPVEMTAGS